jgi:replicative DNA helicase
MQTETNRAAHRYSDEGLSVIWTRPGETPEERKVSGVKWGYNQLKKATPEEIDSYFPANQPDRNIAIVCGQVSGDLEVIDVDQKHDSTETLVDTYLGMINDHLPELYSRLRITRTPSGGCHIYYRCDIIEGNEKIANNTKGETLIETRGQKGYVVAPPSKGYSIIQANTIPTITRLERTILWDIARSLDESTAEEPTQPTPKGKATEYDGLSPFVDYCDKGDVIELLERHGWSKATKVRDGNSDRIHVLRPGDSKALGSGNYHKQLKTLRIFSTSQTDFIPGKAYNPADVYTILECSGDKKAAYKKLLAEGYGQPPRQQQKKAAGQQTEQTQQLPPRRSWIEWLEELAKNKPGNQTGYRNLDSIIALNPGAVTLIAGRPRHGKTTFMLNLLLKQTELYPDKKFIFYTYEEPAKNILIKLLNNQTGADLSNHFNHLGDLKKTNYDFIKHYLRSRSMKPDLKEIETGKDRLGELIDANRLEIIDANYPVEKLREIILRQAKEEPIGGIFFDYVQRMKSSEKQEGIRTKIAHISDQLKDIAKETDIPLIVGSQMNRAGAGEEKKPTLENLKETGNLEEDANTILSVYCDAAEKEYDATGGTFDREVSLEIRVLKNREGEVNGKAVLSWDRYTGKISDSDTQPQKNRSRRKADFN